MDRLGGITPKTLSQRLRELRRRRDRHRRPGAGPAGGLVSPDTGRSRPRARHRRAQLVGATARLAPAPGRRAAARRAPAPLRHPGHRPRRRRPRASPLALPARRRGLPGRKRRPPVVPHRESPARTGRRHDHRDHPSPDRPHLRRVRRRHRHHRRNRASPAIPAADQHHGHRRTSRLDRSRGTGGHVRRALRTACSVCRRPSGRTLAPTTTSRQPLVDDPGVASGRLARSGSLCPIPGPTMPMRPGSRNSLRLRSGQIRFCRNDGAPWGLLCPGHALGGQ